MGRGGRRSITGSPQLELEEDFGLCDLKNIYKVLIRALPWTSEHTKMSHPEDVSIPHRAWDSGESFLEPMAIGFKPDAVTLPLAQTM